MTKPNATLLELDDRRRVSLGRIGRHSRYLVTEQEDGTLVFTPAVVVSELELRIMADQRLVGELDDAIDAAARDEFAPPGWQPSG